MFNELPVDVAASAASFHCAMRRRDAALSTRAAAVFAF
jgi:hypothetical protein